MMGAGKSPPPTPTRSTVQTAASSAQEQGAAEAENGGGGVEEGRPLGGSSPVCSLAGGMADIGNSGSPAASEKQQASGQQGVNASADKE